jgi:hypothetical protein
MRKTAAVTLSVLAMVVSSAFTSSSAAVPMKKCEGGNAENFQIVGGVCVSDGKAEKLRREQLVHDLMGVTPTRPHVRQRQQHDLGEVPQLDVGPLRAALEQRERRVVVDSEGRHDHALRLLDRCARLRGTAYCLVDVPGGLAPLGVGDIHHEPADLDQGAAGVPYAVTDGDHLPDAPAGVEDPVPQRERLTAHERRGDDRLGDDRVVRMLVRDEELGRRHDVAGLEPMDPVEVIGPPPGARGDSVGERPVRSGDDRGHDTSEERIVHPCSHDGPGRSRIDSHDHGPSSGRAGWLNPADIQACRSGLTGTACVPLSATSRLLRRGCVP